MGKLSEQNFKKVDSRLLENDTRNENAQLKIKIKKMGRELRGLHKRVHDGGKHLRDLECQIGDANKNSKAFQGLEYKIKFEKLLQTHNELLATVGKLKEDKKRANTNATQARDKAHSLRRLIKQHAGATLHDKITWHLEND